MERRLILADGTVVSGNAFGSSKPARGELVFTTSMTGYMETLSDPSYRGQMVIFTSPTIANYSPDNSKLQSRGLHASALITRDAHTTLPIGGDWAKFNRLLDENGIPGIDGVDTRFLVRRIREHGVMPAVIADGDLEPEPFMDSMKENLVGQVSTREPEEYRGAGKHQYLLVDLGVKKSIIENLLRTGSVTVVPYDYDIESVAGRYDSVIFSNGPGDPDHKALHPLRKAINRLAGNIPMIGICLGIQVIALSLGGKTVKMKYGHRGSNHAVTDGRKIMITSHNHGYAVDRDSIHGTGLEVLEWDINDGTVEKIRSVSDGILAVQYHPEGMPGPDDAREFFTEVSRMSGAN